MICYSKAVTKSNQSQTTKQQQLKKTKVNTFKTTASSQVPLPKFPAELQNHFHTTEDAAAVCNANERRPLCTGYARAELMHASMKPRKVLGRCIVKADLQGNAANV